MTATITGGSVTFEQSRKLAEYENRKATVTFNVNAPEGEDASAQVSAALSLAQAEVFKALGLVLKTPIGTPSKLITPKDTDAADTLKTAHAETAAAAEKKKPGRPPKVATAPASPPPPPAASAAEVVEDVAQISTGNERIEPTEAVVDDASVVDESLFEAPAEITDTELTSAITRKNAELIKNLGPQAPVKIRALIGKYAPRSQEIKQELRGKFLEELAGLTA